MNRLRSLRKLPDHENGSPGLDLSSLIDVSFLLLIYFLVTSTLDPKETDLVTDVTGNMIVDGMFEGSGPIAIDISSDGIVSTGGEILDKDSTLRELPNLRDKLVWAKRAWTLSNPEGSYGVVVHADNEASGQRFIDVMNCLAEVGISNVILDGFVE